MKKFLLLFLTVMLSMPLVMHAQQTIEIGTGTGTTYYGPYNSLWGYSFVEQIYTAAEIGMPGSITSISFNMSSTDSQTNNITVYMKNVNRSSFSSSADYETVTASDIVYSGSHTFTNGWSTITLTTPFLYDGTSNLMIAVHESTSGYSTRYFYYTSVSNALISFHSDSYNPDPYNLGSYGGTIYTQSYRPNIKLEISSGNLGCMSLTPTVSNVGPYTADLNWMNFQQSAYSWDVLYGVAGTFDTLSGGTMLTNITDTFYTLTGLTSSTEYAVYLKSHCSSEEGTWSAPRIFSTDVSCPVVTNLHASGVSEDEATISWTPGSTETSWEIVFDTSSTAPTALTSPDFTSTDTFYYFQNLTPSTHYYAWVRANCGTGDYSFWTPLAFLTSQEAAQLPYSQDWEDAVENAEWTIDNTGGSNQWHIGTAVNNTQDGDYSLYISNDNGVTNAYTISSASNVWAYRDIDFGTYSEYELSFDVRAQGESCCDYLKVFVGAPAEPSGNTTPAGATQIGSNINLHSSFTHMSATLTSAFNGVQRVYLLWHNDGSVGTMPPAAVDNISIIGSNCGSPYALALDSATTTSITFHFHPASINDASWQAVVVPVGSQIDETQAITLSDTTYEFTNLEPSSSYHIYVRTDCGGEYSTWSIALLASTECDVITTLPYTMNFDDMGTGSTVFPNCWTRSNTYSTSTQYPYVSSSYYHSGNASLYFYSSTSTYNLAVLPPVDTTILPINNLMLSFVMRSTSSTTSSIVVGVMTDPADPNTFTPVTTLNNSAVGIFELKEVLLSNYTGYGAYIAMKLTNSSSTYSVYLDDLQLEVIPTCMRPDNVAVSNITSSGVTVNWTPRNGESTWQVVVVPHGTDPSQGMAEYAYQHPYTLGNLTDNTQYDVYVKSDCGGDESPWSMPVTFYTLCLPTSTIPFVENFNNQGSGNAAFPNCWSRYQTGTTTTYPYISSSYGSGALYFYSYTSVSDYCVSQALDLANEVPGTLQLSFDVYKTSAGYGRLNVGYMTDPGDMSTFHLLKAVYPGDLANTSTWYTFSVDIPAAVHGSLVYLAFEAPISSSSNYIYLDNVTVDYLPTCSAPSALAVTNVAGNSALVSWHEAPYGVVDYTIEYAEAGTTNYQMQTATGSQYMLTGLTEQTTYTVMLYGNCGADYSDTLTTTFSTGCVSGGDIVVGAGTETNYHIPLNTYYNYSYVQELYLANEINYSGDIHSIGFQYIYSTSQTKSNQYIYLAETDQTSLTTWIPYDSLTLVYHGSINYNNSGADNWVTITLDTVFNYSGTRNLVVVIKNDHGTYTTSNNSTFKSHAASGKTLEYYDDDYAFSFTSPDAASTYSYRNNIKFGMDCDNTVTCVAPNVYVESFDATSATIAWAAGGSESSWEMEYQESGSSTWTSVGTVTSSPYILDNLTSNNTYQVRMRSDCGGEYSTWAVTTVTIPCFVAALPFEEDFNSATGTGSSNSVPCWTKVTNYSTAYPYPSSTYTHSPQYSIYFYASSAYYSMLVSPRFDDSIEMDSLQISFWSYKTSASYFIEVGILSDPADASTFTSIGTFSPSVVSTWEKAEFKTNNYTGNGHYVAFRVPQWISNYQYLDDVTIDYIPACLHVENLTASNISANSADITWTPGGDEDSWEILYGDNVDVNVDVPTVVYDTLYALSGLTSNTEYDVYVRGNCQGGDHSSWEQITFHTECDPIVTLPYYHNFDSSYTHTANTTSGANNLAACWDGISTGTTYTSYPFVYYSSSYANSGSYCLRFYSYYSGSYGTQYAFLPPMDMTTLSFQDLLLEFQMKNGYSSAPFTLVVGVTEGTDLSTFVPVDTISQTSTAYQVQSVAFNNYQGNGNRIVIANPKPASSYSYGQIDDIMLSAPTCIYPNDLMATDATTDAVTISWNERGSATTWNIEYGYTGFTPGTGTTVQVTTNPYTVTGLASGTTYDFYVQSLCSATDVSELSAKTSASTNMVPADLPYATDFSDPTDAWILNNGTCSNYWTRGTVNGTSALFVTHNGTTPGYDGNSISQVSAEKLFTVGTDATITVQFDVQVQGESSFDYMKLFLAPATQEYPAATTVSTSDYGYNSYSTYAYNFYANNYGGESSTYPYILNQTGGTIHVTALLPNPNTNPTATSTAKLVFAWKNDGTVTYEPGAIVSNLQIGDITCPSPTNVTVTNIGTTSANVSWTAGGTETAWNLQYKESTASTWGTVIPLTTPSYQLTGLTAQTSYNVRVQADCGSGDESTFANYSFNTSSCEVTDQCGYTFVLGDGYGDGWNGASMNVVQGGTVVATLAAVDYVLDDEQTYDTVTVNLCDNVSTTLSWTSGDYDDEISVYVYGPDGTLVMSQVDFDYYTPYTFTTDCSGSGPATCNAPTGLAVNNPGQTTATATWTAGGTETSWNVQYKAASASSWQNATANATSYTMTGLTPATNYQVRVQAVCDASNTSDWTTAVSFTTANEDTPTCPAPTNLTATVDHTDVTLTWQQEPNTANEWQINYRLATESTWSTATATSTTYTLTDLTANAQYVANVVAHCTNGLTSDESNTVTFETNNIGVEDYLSKAVTLYPNPATEMVSVAVSDANIMITGVEVYNVYGQLINTIVSTENPLRINVSGLADGMYYVRVTTDNGVVTKNFVKR